MIMIHTSSTNCWGVLSDWALINWWKQGIICNRRFILPAFNLWSYDIVYCLQLFWRHCVVQRFLVVEQWPEGLGFQSALMIGLNDSQLSIVDEYFLGLFSYATSIVFFLFCCSVLITTQFLLLTTLVQLHSQQNNHCPKPTSTIT